MTTTEQYIPTAPLCRRCGQPDTAPDAELGAGLCFDCFRQAVDELTRRITAAKPGELDTIYIEGMRTLDARP